MFNKIRIYGFWNSVILCIYILRTKLLFKNAKLIRFPIDVRGHRYIGIGDGFTSGSGCRFEAFPDKIQTKDKILEIGRNVQVNDYVHITAIDSVIIEDNVLIASKVYISDSTHGIYYGSNQSDPDSIVKERKLSSKPVIIKNNAWLGENVAILPGVTIGASCIIGANSVVTKSIPDKCIAVGNPAKIIKIYNDNSKIWEKV